LDRERLPNHLESPGAPEGAKGLAMQISRCRWAPNPPNKWRNRVVEGYLQEEIKNDEGGNGWHIYDDTDGYVHRVWAEEGTFEWLPQAVLPPGCI
jgi:hypothetical protein